MKGLGLATNLSCCPISGGLSLNVMGFRSVPITLRMIVGGVASGAGVLSAPVSSVAGSEQAGGGSKQAGGADSSGSAASGSTPDYWSHVGKRLFSDPLCWLDVKPEQRAQYYSEKTPEPQEPFSRSELPQRSQPSLTDEQQSQLDGPLFLINRALNWLESTWVRTPNPKTATCEVGRPGTPPPTVSWPSSDKAGSVGSSPSHGFVASKMGYSEVRSMPSEPNNGGLVSFSTLISDSPGVRAPSLRRMSRKFASGTGGSLAWYAPLSGASRPAYLSWATSSTSMRAPLGRPAT